MGIRPCLFLFFFFFIFFFSFFLIIFSLPRWWGFPSKVMETRYSWASVSCLKSVTLAGEAGAERVSTAADVSALASTRGCSSRSCIRSKIPEMWGIDRSPGLVPISIKSTFLVLSSKKIEIQNNKKNDEWKNHEQKITFWLWYTRKVMCLSNLFVLVWESVWKYLIYQIEYREDTSEA